jgi:hypothetical protein
MARPRRTLNVKPGEQLGFARELAAARAWPPTRIKRMRPDVPAATPYLVVPADANDLGGRPLAGSEAVHSASVEIVDAGGAVTTSPVPGASYTLRATVRNLGAAPSYAGIVEFAVADPGQVEAAVGGVAVSIPTLAVQGFVVQSGATISITCQRPWAPATPAEAAATVVVHGYDLLLDPVERRFDARADRHVGRRYSVH